MANETILIVDADTKSQKVLEVSFKKAGYRVVMTDGPSRARELVQDIAPDIIISDTQFPNNGNGFEFLADIRQGELKATPFIFLTEERALPQKMKGFELGADDYLTKPIYIKEVTTRVELLLQKRAKEQLTEEDVEELEGNIADITMIDLLQTIEEELRSGTIHLSRDHQSAVIYFREGNILDAICGKLQGEEAIYRLMLWPDGEFVLRYHDQVRRVDRIEKDSGALLLEGIRRLDEYNEAVDSLPNLGRVFEADYKQLAQVISQLPDEVARVLRLFDGLRSIEEVAEGSPLDDITTLRIVAKLVDDEYLVDVTPQRGARERERSRSNLATWLEGARAKEVVDGASHSEIGREDTSPKFGSSITEMTENKRATQPGHTAQRRETLEGLNIDPAESLGDTPPADENEGAREPKDTSPFGSRSQEREGEGWGHRETIPLVDAIDRLDDLDDHVPKDARRSTMLQWDRPRSGWNIHFDGPEEDEDEAAIREIEEGERRRREQEAQQLSGESRDSTLRFAPAVDREDGDEPNEHLLRQIEEDERQRREEEARRLQQQFSSLDVEVGSDDRPRRVTDELGAQPRVPQISADDRVDTDELFGPDSRDSRAPRVREATPRSAPVSGALEPDAGDDVSEPVQKVEVTEEEINELFDSQVAPEPEKVEASEESEPDGSDDKSDAEAAAADDEPGSEPEQDGDADDSFNERQTLDIRPPSNLTPLGVEASEPEVTPDIDPAGLFKSLANEDTAPGEEDEEDLEIVAVEPLEELPRVERQAKDRELVHTEYDLGKRKTIAPFEIDGRPEAMAERETVELDADTPDVAPPGVRASEQEFFSRSSSHDDLGVDDFGSAGDDRLMPLLIGMLVVAVLAIGALFMFGDDIGKPDDIARNDTPTEPSEPDEPTEPDEPLPVEPPTEPTGLDADAASAEAVVYGTDLTRQTTELAMVLSGADLFGADVGVAGTEPDAGQVAVATNETPTEPAEPTEPVEQPKEPVEQPTEPVEQPDEPSEPVAVKDPEPEEKPPPSASTDTASLREAERLVRRERFEEALPMLRELSKSSSGDGKVAYLHGKAAFNTNKTGEAVDNLARAERLGYRTADLYLDLAAALMLDGKRDRAKWAYEKFLKKQPNGKVADQVRAILDAQF